MKLKLFLINSFSNVAVQLFSNLLSFITLPLYLKNYGDELYGIFLLSISLNTSLSTVGFGLNSGLKRFTAEYSATKDLSKFNPVVSFSFSSFILIGIINSLVLFFLSFYFTTFFKIESKNLEISIYIFQLAACYSLFFWISKFSRGILEGYQLQWLFNLTNGIQTVGSLVIYILVITLKINFFTFSLLSFITFILPIGAQWIIILHKKLLKGIKIKFGFQKGTFKTEFFQVSKDLFLLGVIAFFSTNADQYILSAIMGPSIVTAYFVVTKPTQILKILNNYLFAALDPLIAKEHHLGNQELIDKIKKQGTVLQFIFITPLILAVIFFLFPFINLWIGNKYQDFIIWGQLSALSLIFTPYFNTTNKITINTGNPRYIRNVNFYTVLINFIVSVIATFYFGLGGVIIGTFVQMVLKVIIFSIYYNQVSQSSFDLYLLKKLGPWFISIIIFCTIIFNLVSIQKINNWVTFTTFGIAFTIILYLLSLIFFIPELRSLINKKSIRV